METKNAEIILDHHTHPVVLCNHEIYDLFKSDRAHVLNQSFGSHHESCLKQLEFVTSSKLTPA